MCLVGWFYWQASTPHYPSLSSLHRAAVRPLESTALSAQGWDCSFTTGSARKPDGSEQSQGWSGWERTSWRIRPSPVRHRHTARGDRIGRASEMTEFRLQKKQTLKKPSGDLLSHFLRVQLQLPDSRKRAAQKYKLPDAQNFY